jgi:hypothetical protein
MIPKLYTMATASKRGRARRALSISTASTGRIA